MRIKLVINEHTTDSELVHLGNFFSALGLNRGAHVVSAPADEAELDDPDEPEVPEPTADDAHIDFTKSAAPVEAPKRRRRTKGEIEAAAAAAAAAPGTTVESTEPVQDGTIEPGEPGNDQPAPTPSVEPQDTPPSETASKEPATESPSDGKTYTPAEVQKIAVATAGRFGPEKVKAIIAQYPGAARIADLPLTELAGFVAKLNAVS